MKKLQIILPLLIIFCFMVSCQDKEAIAELENLKIKIGVEEKNSEIIKHLIDELNNGNVDIANELYSPDCLMYSPSTNPEPLNREETIEFAKMIFTAFPDANYLIKELFAVGDRVILWNVFTGTHEGEFQGIPPTGNRIEVSSILLYRIENGKIVEEREELDMLGAMMQLGMELKPKDNK